MGKVIFPDNPTKNTEKNCNIVARIMDMAKQHLDNDAEMASSATLCYRDACDIMYDAWKPTGKKDIGNAAGLALKSLRYSVGTFHGDYQIASYLIRHDLA